jgi:large subunit ribosomal protein L20
MNYSIFINRLKKSNIEINRKMLAQLAILDPSTFEKLTAKINN